MAEEISWGAWARRFFGGSNTLQWEDVQAGMAPDDWVADILPWMELLERGDLDVPAILPHRDAGGRITWYGVARTPRAALGLGEDLAGHIGATYGAFTGRPHPLDASNESEAALAVAFVAPVFRICPETATDVAQIRRSIRLYRVVLERRPPASRLAARSLGVLRSRFDRALLAGNESEGQRLFDEILATGRLSWDNRLYLRIRFYAGLGLWPQIAGDAGLLQDSIHLALPAQVRADLVEALYRTHAEPWEETNDAAGALAAFRTAELQRFHALFATRQGIEQPRVVKAFLLYSLLRSSPNRDELDKLCSLLPEGTPAKEAFSAALRELAVGHEAAPSGEPDLEAAEQALDELDYDRALALFNALPPTRKVLGRLLTCAKTIHEPGAAQIALASLDAWPEGVQDLPATMHSVIADLRLLVAAQVLEPGALGDTQPAAVVDLPGDWLSWARWLNAGAPVELARRLLDDRSSTWSVDSLRHDPQAVFDLAQFLGNASGEAGKVVQHAFPHLFEVFVFEPGEAIPAWKPLYATMLTLLAMAEGLSVDDLELARMVAAALLEAGVDQEEYRSLILDLEELLDRQASLATIDWALDMAEVLAVNRAPLMDLRLGFVMKVLGTAQFRAHRLAPAQIEMFRLLCQDIDIALPPYLSAAIEEGGGIVGVTDLSGRSVAIYTLVESAGQRAKNTLRKLFPTVEVSLNSDMVCSERLAALARRADIFVFAWKSSKHAAYYCVKENRPKSWPILMPRGKGSASIVRELTGA